MGGAAPTAASRLPVEVNNSKRSMDCGAASTQSVAFAHCAACRPTPDPRASWQLPFDIDRVPPFEATADLNARWLRPGYRHNVDISTDYEQTNSTTTDDNADAQLPVRPATGQRLVLVTDGRATTAMNRGAGAGVCGRWRLPAGSLTPGDNLTLSIQGGRR